MKVYSLVIVLAILVNCASQSQLIQPEPIKQKTARTFNVEFDSIWNKTLLLVQSYPLASTDKASGLIVTDWRSSQQTRTVKINRGLVFGGMVEDQLPLDVKDRLNILLQKSTDGVRVNITRHVQVRPWLQEVGPVGAWQQNLNGQYHATTSNTLVENALLDALESQLVVR